MMALFLGYKTAWNIWRMTGDPEDARKCLDFAIPFPSRAVPNRAFYGYVPLFDSDTRRDLELFEIHDEQPDVVVATSGKRRSSKRLNCRLQGLKLPAKSFYELSPNIMIAAPELVFLHLAAQKDVVLGQLVFYGLELCGSYGCAPGFDGAGRMFRRAPLTSVKEIKGYISHLEKMNQSSRPALMGLKRARRALRYMVDGSASPMESVLAILLSLSPVEGGYGLPLPTLNECMVNGTSIFRDTGRHALVGDLFWAKQRVDLEYDSDAFHTSGESLHRDAAKRNALLDNNFTVLTANARHVKELFEMDILANQLRRALHVRSRVAKCRFDDKRKQLRQEVFEAAGLDSLGWR